MTKEDIIDLLKTVEPKINRVVVIPDEKEKVMGGIHLSQTAMGEDELQIGTVIAVGKGYHADNAEFIETSTKVGDRVLMGIHSGDTIRVDLDKNILPSHIELSGDLVPVRIIIETAIIWTFPENWDD